VRERETARKRTQEKQGPRAPQRPSCPIRSSTKVLARATPRRRRLRQAWAACETPAATLRQFACYFPQRRRPASPFPKIICGGTGYFSQRRRPVSRFPNHMWRIFQCVRFEPAAPSHAAAFGRLRPCVKRLQEKTSSLLTTYWSEST